MANEKEQLPVWLSAGIEPPETLKQNGWQAGVKPPAQYMDWFFNRTYMVLKQLQEDGGTTVEDTLTSDSTANALSAKQGKVLNGKYTELSYLFNNWHNTDYVPTKAALTSHLEQNNTQAHTIDNIDGLRNEINKIGNLTSLATTNKTNIVEAVNELFTNASNGKTSIANAVATKGVTASSSDTFTQLANKIGQISTGKKYATGQIYYSSSNKTLSVSGLDFTPSCVIGFISSNGNVYTSDKIQTFILLNSYDIYFEGSYYKNSMFYRTGNGSGNTIPSHDSNSNIVGGGFNITLKNSTETNGRITWKAFE